MCSFTSRRWSGPVWADLNEGQQIEYEVVANRGKESAENLKVK